MTEWAFTGGPPSAPPTGTPNVLVEGANFCIAGPSGDIEDAAGGLFVRDTRVLSYWLLEVDGQRVEHLAVVPEDPFGATYVARTRPAVGLADSELLVVRRRSLGHGIIEHVEVRNLGAVAVNCAIDLHIDADFAHLFEVKEGRVPPLRGDRDWTDDQDGVRLEYRDGPVRRALTVLSTMPGLNRPGAMHWDVALAGGESWSTTLRTELDLDGVHLTADPDEAFASAPARRLARWRGTTTRITSPDDTLVATLRRSREDIGLLRVFVPGRGDRPVVAAGAPWFMTLFGRDSLLTSWMTLGLDHELALGSLDALAMLQGQVVDPDTEEEPGRIAHETRFGIGTGSMHGSGHVYYGSVDSTPLFVGLLAELRRWGVDRAALAPLLVHADRALEWIDGYGDRDGDGFVEYERATPAGLRNQGWKDSFDGINFADGHLAEAPIALAEVQGYVYQAYRGRAEFARDDGDAQAAAGWDARADDLKRAFNEAFWLPDRGWYAVALDRDKRPVDALTSNIGHCLWSGIVDEDKAASVAAHLMSDAMFSGWGVRTLASNMGAYNPMSYHNGSVWPHDNAIVAAGLMRYGFVEEAQRIALALLDAADHVGYRLPELFCGFDRDEFSAPIPYPTSCSPQAWAAAAPVQLLRSLLGFEPSVPNGEVRIDAHLPQRMIPLDCVNLALAGSRIRLRVGSAGTTVNGLPDGVAFVDGALAPANV